MPRNKSGNNRHKQQDNKTVLEKAHLRKRVLGMLEQPPVILETHGGNGGLYLRCYKHITDGIVFETDAKKAETLTRQRPTWSVCQTDCVWSLQSGVGSHLDINFILTLTASHGRL